MSIRFLVAFLLLLFSSNAPAQSVRETLDNIRVDHAVPAIALRVTRGDEVIVNEAVGQTSVESDDEVKLDDAWHLGSDTKAMTATLAARLVERGLITWDTKLIDAIPEIRERIAQEFHNVTLEALLTQRSGIDPARETSTWLLGMHVTNEERGVHQRRVDTIVELMRDSPIKPTTQPAFAYANGNYIAAGAMLESVTGKTWESLMQEEIFDPLKMVSAGFGPPTRITGHTTSNDKLIAAKFDNPVALGPAGTVHCSLEDWGKFLSVHLGKSDGFLKPETLARLQSPPAGSTYAMGWIVNDLGERGVLLSHDGSNTLWYARVILIPKQDVMILVAMNSSNVKACEAATQLAVQELQK